MIDVVPFIDEGLGRASYLADLGAGRALIGDPPRLPESQIAQARTRELTVAKGRSRCTA